MNETQLLFANIIKTQPIKIAHKLGFNLLTDLHNDWIKEFLFGKDDYSLFAHRGSYKTTAVAIALALMLIIFPDECILFMRKTENDIIEIMRSVSKILKTDVIKGIVKILYGIDLELVKDTNSEISTNLQQGNKGTPQLTGLGSTSSLTGKHYERIFTDDISNLKDRTSKAERERVKLVYQELQNLKNRGGKIVNTGTKWHKEAVESLMPNQEVYTCYDTDIMSSDDIKDIRTKMTPTLFAANYELKHIADENALFKNPNYTDKVESIYNGLAHIDAQFGGQDTTAFTILRKLKNGDYIGYGKVWSQHVDKCLPEIYTLQNKYQAGTIYLETNADKGYLARDIAKDNRAVSTYHESQNKFVKITTYLYGSWAKIYWLDDTDPEYLTQILDFQEGQEPDDCPDSAASLIRVYEKQTVWTGQRPI
jgi:hypothetical protein